MSNLIKSNFIYFDRTDTRVIDSNIRTDSFPPFVFQNYEEKSIDESEFIDGISPDKIQKLLISEEELAKENAERILDEARKKADEILNQALMEAETNKEAIYEEARTNGYNEGYHAGSADIEELQKKLNNDIIMHEKEYENQITELEPKIVDLLISLIQKITGVIIENKREVILHIVKNALKNADNCKEFLIKVSKDDYTTVNNKKEEICSNLKDDVMVEIVEDSGLSKNQCMIETETSIIDCSLDVQYQNLITDMKLLSNDTKMSYNS